MITLETLLFDNSDELNIDFESIEIHIDYQDQLLDKEFESFEGLLSQCSFAERLINKLEIKYGMESISEIISVEGLKEISKAIWEKLKWMAKQLWGFFLHVFGFINRFLEFILLALLSLVWKDAKSAMDNAINIPQDIYDAYFTYNSSTGKIDLDKVILSFDNLSRLTKMSVQNDLKKILNGKDDMTQEEFLRSYSNAIKIVIKDQFTIYEKHFINDKSPDEIMTMDLFREEMNYIFKGKLPDYLTGKTALGLKIPMLVNQQFKDNIAEAKQAELKIKPVMNRMKNYYGDLTKQLEHASEVAKNAADNARDKKEHKKFMDIFEEMNSHNEYLDAETDRVRLYGLMIYIRIMTKYMSKIPNRPDYYTFKVLAAQVDKNAFSRYVGGAKHEPLSFNIEDPFDSTKKPEAPNPSANSEPITDPAFLIS